MRAIIAIVLCMVSFSSCSVEYQEPTHVAEWHMSPSKYPELLRALDQAIAPFDLKRFGAAPGLKELTDRDVLYAAYRANSESPYAALDMTDIKVSGRVEMFVYADYFDDVSTRNRFITTIKNAINSFGGHLAPR